MVVARSGRGEFAVMDGHAPLLAALGDAPLRIKAGNEETVLVCFGGTLRVDGDGAVDVLVEDAAPLEEIDLEEVNRRLSSVEGVNGQERLRLSLLKRVKERYG